MNRNRTDLYIKFCINAYEGFTKLFPPSEDLEIIGKGVNDYALPNYEKFNNHLFLLFKVVNVESFNVFIEDFRKTMYYEHDYVFDAELNHQMIVIKLPVENVVKYFLESKYSKMYDKEFIDMNMKKKTIISNNIKPSHGLCYTYDVLYANDEAKFKIVEGLGLKPSTTFNELDSKVKLEEEIFNFYSINTKNQILNNHLLKEIVC